MTSSGELDAREQRESHVVRNHVKGKVGTRCDTISSVNKEKTAVWVSVKICTIYIQITLSLHTHVTHRVGFPPGIGTPPNAVTKGARKERTEAKS